MKIGLGYFINIFLVLFVIMIFVYAANYLLNYMPGKKSKNRRLKVLEYLPLQPQTGLYIIALDNKELLVSVSNKAINKIIQLSSNNFKDELKQKQKDLTK